MIVLLSPAKTLDFTENGMENFSTPRMLEDANKLVKVLRKKSVRAIKDLMKVSDNIANLNVQRYQEFSTPFTPENARQSVLAFKGDVYTGLQADTFDEADLAFAQQHIRILSGLYGLLRPLDLMQAYRLEMGTKLKQGRYKDLYHFWGDRITDLINEDLALSGNDTLINLASKEYFSSVNTKKIKGKLIHVHFKEMRGDKLKVIAFNAKKARGAMAHHIVKCRISNPELIKELTVNDYQFNASYSDAENFTFVKV